MFEFSKFFAIQETWDVLKDIELYLETTRTVKPTKETLPHIDPISKKPWRAGNKMRHLQAILVDQKRKGINPSDVWVSFTNVNKLGIYPKADDGGTPFGIYAYPAEYVLERNGSVPFGGDRPYLQVFRVKPSIRRAGKERKSKIMQVKPWKDFRGKKSAEENFSKLPSMLNKVDLQRVLNDFRRSVFNNIGQILNTEFYEVTLPNITKKRLNIFKDQFKEMASLSHAQKRQFMRYLSNAINGLNRSIVDAYNSTPGEGEEKAANFEPKLKTIFDAFHQDVAKPIQQGPNVFYYYHELEDFIKNLDFDDENDYDGPYKYTNIDLIKGTAEYTEEYAKYAKQHGPKKIKSGQTVKIDDIFKIPSVKNYRNYVEYWEDFQKQRKLWASIDQTFLEKWGKFIVASTKKLLKNYFTYLKSLEKEIDFPFSKFIKKFAHDNGLDWQEAVRSGTRRGKGVGAFLYQVSHHLASQLGQKRPEEKKGRHWVDWTMILRSMGIDGFADRYDKGVIHSSERTQGVFFGANMLRHIAQIDKESYVDRTYQHGKPPLEFGNLLVKFKKENGIDPYNTIRTWLFQQKKDIKKFGEHKAPWSVAIETKRGRKNVRIGKISDAEKYAEKAKRNHKLVNPSVDDSPGMIPDDLDRKWGTFLDTEFKRKHSLERNESIPNKLRDKYDGFMSRGRYFTGRSELWGRGQHKYYVSQAPTLQSRGVRVSPGSYASSELEKTLSAIQQQLSSAEIGVLRLADSISHKSTFHDWQNEFDRDLTVIIKLARSYQNLKSAHELKKPQIQQFGIDDVFARIIGYVTRIVTAPKFSTMWKGPWSGLAKKADIAMKLMMGTRPEKIPTYSKRKYWNPEEYKKATRILYPGEEKITSIPENIRNTPATKLNFWNVDQYGKEAWKNLVKFQLSIGMIHKPQFDELINQWDWIWDDPIVQKHKRTLEDHNDLKNMNNTRLYSVLKDVPNEESLKKLIKYQEVLNKHSPEEEGEILKDMLSKLQVIQKYKDVFKDLDASFVVENPGYLGPTSMIHLGKKRAFKVLEFQKDFGIINDLHYKRFLEEFQQKFDKLEELKKIGIPDDAIEEVYHGVVPLWHTRKKYNIENFEQAKKILDFQQSNHIITLPSYRRALDVFKLLFENPPPGEEYHQTYYNYPYGFRDGGWDLNEKSIKKSFESYEKFLEFLGYGLSVRDYNTEEYKRQKKLADSIKDDWKED
jgi:hypothetical protein